ncbi:MAG: hypothetical protein ACI8QC_003755 [Planctomycetota bacterium]|jgi:hypothetical protein
MNRTTALLVALGALVAHTLAIHLGPAGHFGDPYDSAHVAFKLGRNLARGAGAVWIPGGGAGAGGLESYPSPLWVGLCWAIEYVSASPVRWTQISCLVAALLSVMVSGRVAAKRFVGVVPPMLLVLSGAWAAASASGTEHTLTALALTVAFVAGEHRRAIAFAAGLALLASARPEGMLIALLLGGGYVLMPRARRGTRSALPLITLLPTALVFLGLWLHKGSDQTPLLVSLLEPFTSFERTPQGFSYLRNFAKTSVIPALLFVPLVPLMAGRLSSAGARALFVALVWAGLVVLSGGGAAPFGLALVPVLPLAAIAIQEGLLGALDTGEMIFERAAWVLLSTAAAVSLVASRFPGDLGPVPLKEVHEVWMAVEEPPAYGISPMLGRSCLEDEVRIAGRMRALGIFLRDEVGAGYSILSPWPGALGYLSELDVHDWFSRTDHAPGVAPVPSWLSSPAPIVDLLAPVQELPDFILPGVISAQAASHGDLGTGIDQALFDLDKDPSTDRARRLQALMDGYELLTLPVEPPGRGTPQPFYLLRRKDLNWAPSLEIRHSAGEVLIELRMGASQLEPTPGHRLLAHIEVEIRDAAGDTWWLTPSGELSATAAVVRPNLLLNPKGEQPTELLRWNSRTSPNEQAIVSMTARILNPGVRIRHQLAEVGEPAILNF